MQGETELAKKVTKEMTEDIKVSEVVLIEIGLGRKATYTHRRRTRTCIRRRFKQYPNSIQHS